ncbi:SDR family oxidoreductase [Chitinophaga qingshengii]|uniref:SDR family NAD(P)-dependent oxidoreductase n=1 Tax=Chitinophaga qingshengii TaxID=1569794 RepID=A0ABR7TRN5_9BACT|nr:SDR family NAD(P)-dependent oxidoreductase [Chitinophaga qingshengii]MBC9932054.1 SDR family NAD(P)-dependent oxidoreductase [Chitinophaga qingshengii]
MKTNGNTVLITGGSAGIGLALAQTLLAAGNTVIITGRDALRLEEAVTGTPGLIPIVCDVTRDAQVKTLVKTLQQDYPQLNMLINNAGKAHVYRLSETAGVFDKAADEMLTNYLAVMQLTELLLPLLARHSEAAIVNVSSVLALVPMLTTPSYAASKAALHSYTQSLRLSVAPIRVFELMPPLANTHFSRDIGGSNGIAPETVATGFMEALQNDVYEIHVGQTQQVFQLLQSTSPANALQMLNAHLLS